MTTLAIAYTPAGRASLVSLSFTMKTFGGGEVGASFLIREDGVTAPAGVNPRDIAMFGVQPKVAVAVLMNLVPLASRLAIHEAPRLVAILSRYLADLGRAPEFPPARKLVVDTQEVARCFCRLPAEDGYRPPTLGEATRILLGAENVTAAGVLALADHLTKSGAMEAA